MSKQLKHLYEFGSFRFDPAERLLLRDGTPVPLTPKVCETLLLLVQSAGRLVEKDELMKGVWPEAFVEEANLARNIWTLRKALGDSEGKHQYIETVPKLGYRFVAPVSELPNEGLDLVVERHVRARIVTEQYETVTDGSGTAEVEETPLGVQTLSKPIEPPPEGESIMVPASSSLLTDRVIVNRSERRRGLMAAAAVSALSIIAVIAAVMARNRRLVSIPHAVDSVAVLPFANASGDSELEYLSDGLTESLINRLSRASHVKIIAHSSVARYQGGEIDPLKIGRELGVQAILMGRVRQHGDELSVSAELVDARDSSHLWGERYDRKATDLMFLQKELAEHIADGLRLQFSGEDQKRFSKSYTENVEAYRLYLKGRYFWNKRTEADLRKGIEYFQKSLAQDPGYAQAYAGLADSHIILANWNVAPPGEAYAKAKAAALKALELDDQLAEAHTSLAYTTLLYEWDWAGAEKRFRRAIELNPNYASAHHFYSICLMTAGRHSEALAEIQRAQELDPLSLIINDVLGWIYYEGRQFDQATVQYAKTLEMDPNYPPALLDLGTNHMRSGKYREAIVQFEKAKAASSENGVVLSDLAQAYALSGHEAEARKILQQLQQPTGSFFVSQWDLALVYLALGDKAKALELLEKAADERVGWVVRLGVDPAFDSIRNEPQFEKLKRRIGIPAPPH